jgi:hypothetical protein
MIRMHLMRIAGNNDDLRGRSNNIEGSTDPSEFSKVAFLG